MSVTRVTMARASVAAALAGALLSGCAAAGIEPPAPTAPGAAAAAVVPAPPTTSDDASASVPVDDPDRCRLALLGARITTPSDAGSQRTVRVVWTNTTDRACTLSGHGEAVLQAAPGESWTSESQFVLREQETETPSVRLEPGGEAHTTITYLPGEASGFTPSTVVVTPPGTDGADAAVLAWPGGPVSYQAGATRPGSFVGPVEPGA